MTSQKSSVNPRFYTFRTALGSNFLLPLLNALALTFFIPVLNFIFIREYDAGNSMQAQGAASSLKETYQYILLSSGDSVTTVFMILVTVLCSVLLGVMLFRFIASKKTVNVFYSLGITRKSLFVSKYLAGILLLVVSVALPMLINLGINVAYFGSSWQLWSATAYYFWSFSILACFAFTVTAAVFSCVGTVAEGCVFPLAILGAPTIVLYCLQYLMETLYGNPYGHYFSGYSAEMLPTAFQGFNPFLFLYDGLGSLRMLDGEGKLVPGPYGQEGAPWSKPEFLPLILWTAAVVAVMFLGMYLFQKRKAEICGFLGANPVLNFLITFLIGLFGFGLVIHYTEANLGMVPAILIGLAVYAVLYCVIDMALIRNGKEFLRGLKKLPIHLGAALVIGVLFATGLFGFSARLPELSEIKSVAVTSPTNVFNGLIGNGSSHNESNFTWAPLGGLQEGITGEADISFVRKLHEQIIQNGEQAVTANQREIPREEQVVGGTVQVVYELKNGKKLMRNYESIEMKLLNELTNVEDTDAGRERIQALLTKPIQTSDYASRLAQTIQNDGEVSLAGPYLERETPLNLEASQRKALVQCIADDLAAQKAVQRYFPTAPIAGLLNIQDSDRSVYMGGMSGDESRSPHVEPYSGYTVYLTQDMKKTIQFLQANGLNDSLNKPVGVESVEIVRAKEPNSDPRTYARSNYGIMYSSRLFLGSWKSEKAFLADQKSDQKAEQEGYGYHSAFADAVKLSDAKQAQEVASLSHINYFYGVDGYFVRAKLADGQGYTCMFLPESAAPQYVKDAVK